MRNLLFCLMVMLAGFSTPTDASQSAPVLIIKDLKGQTFDLGKLHGKVVIINFWATWCPPCREEMPILDKFYRRYHKQGLEMIGVSVDRPQDIDAVRKAMESFNYPMALLNEAETNTFGKPQALPVTYVIGDKGAIQSTLTPDKLEVTDKSLSEAVLPLLHPAPK